MGSECTQWSRCGCPNHTIRFRKGRQRSKCCGESGSSVQKRAQSKVSAHENLDELGSGTDKASLFILHTAKRIHVAELTVGSDRSGAANENESSNALGLDVCCGPFFPVSFRCDIHKCTHFFYLSSLPKVTIKQMPALRSISLFCHRIVINGCVGLWQLYASISLKTRAFRTISIVRHPATRTVFYRLRKVYQYIGWLFRRW